MVFHLLQLSHLGDQQFMKVKCSLLRKRSQSYTSHMFNLLTGAPIVSHRKPVPTQHAVAGPLAIKRNYATFHVSCRPPRSSGRSMSPTIKSKSPTIIRSSRNPWTLVETGLPRDVIYRDVTNGFWSLLPTSSRFHVFLNSRLV